MTRTCRQDITDDLDPMNPHFTPSTSNKLNKPGSVVGCLGPDHVVRRRTTARPRETPTQRDETREKVTPVNLLSFTWCR